MKASVATAIALASSSIASGKYSLYHSYNTLYVQLSYLHHFTLQILFSKAGSDLYMSIISRRFLWSLSFFFSTIITMIITRPQLANSEKIDR